MKKRVYRVLKQHRLMMEVIEIECDTTDSHRIRKYHELIEELERKLRHQVVTCQLLEISSRTPQLLGNHVRASRLMLECRGEHACVESVYLSQLKFSYGGPYHDVLTKPLHETRQDIRFKASGRVIRAMGEHYDWPREYLSYYYAWLYIQALLKQPDLATALCEYDAFSDVSFDPHVSAHCVAEAAAIYATLVHHDLLQTAMKSPVQFIYTVRRIKKIHSKSKAVACHSFFCYSRARRRFNASRVWFFTTCSVMPKFLAVVLMS